MNVDHKLLGLHLALRDAIRKRQWRRGYELGDKIDSHLAVVEQRRRHEQLMRELQA